MKMIEWLLKIDIGLFRLINDSMQNPVLDFLAPIITDKHSWTPVFLIVMIGLAWKGGYRGRMALLLTIPVIVLADQTSASILKPLAGRIRPCVALENVHALIGIKKSFSFPSSHATNSFAAAMLFAYFYPAQKFWFFALAAVIAFTRVYVGVHYPADVFFGALLGILCTKVVIYLYQTLEKKFGRLKIFER